MAKRIDLLAHDEGSVYLLRAASRRGQRWIEERISDDHQEWCGAIAVHHRYIANMVRGAVAEGLRVQRRGYRGLDHMRPASTTECPDIAGADDVLVPREIESGNPDRWAEYNRKFNAIFTRSAR